MNRRGNRAAAAAATPKSNARRQALEQLYARICDVSPLPAVALKIIQVSSDHASRLDDLREVLQSDPSLTAQLLRRLNSPYYGLSTRVADVSTAVQLLGFREVRNLAITIFVIRMFDQPGSFGTYSRSGLLNHLIAVAAASHLISRVCCRAIPSEAFLCGLLHDIGFVLMDIHMRRQFSQMVTSIDPAIPTPEVEDQVYGFDHADLGAYVASRWQFPRPIVDAIRFHHRADEYPGMHRDLVFVIAVANYLCSRSGWMSLGMHNVPPPSDRVYAGLGLDEIALGIIWEELRPTLDKATLLGSST